MRINKEIIGTVLEVLVKAYKTIREVITVLRGMKKHEDFKTKENKNS